MARENVFYPLLINPGSFIKTKVATFIDYDFIFPVGSNISNDNATAVHNPHYFTLSGDLAQLNGTERASQRGNRLSESVAAHVRTR